MVDFDREFHLLKHKLHNNFDIEDSMKFVSKFHNFLIFILKLVITINYSRVYFSIE